MLPNGRASGRSLDEGNVPAAVGGKLNAVGRIGITLSQGPRLGAAQILNQTERRGAQRQPVGERSKPPEGGSGEHHTDAENDKQLHQGESTDPPTHVLHPIVGVP